MKAHKGSGGIAPLILNLASDVGAPAPSPKLGSPQRWSGRFGNEKAATKCAIAVPYIPVPVHLFVQFVKNCTTQRGILSAWV